MSIGWRHSALLYAKTAAVTLLSPVTTLEVTKEEVGALELSNSKRPRVGKKSGVCLCSPVATSTSLRKRKRVSSVAREPRADSPGILDEG